MKKKAHVSETPATQFLRENGVPFTEHVYEYVEHGGTSESSRQLGVPETEHQRFREGFGMSHGAGTVGKGNEHGDQLNPLAWLDTYFAEYIEDRRRAPRKDVLTDLALATYPDGETPEIDAVVRTATFLFAAGQETTARLLADALKHL
ncbi:MAG: hypothetical protein Q8K41_05025, partial [Hydrogenophaga sp.]|nr:hypothetical protein [Hydrogenophaga sp.]